MIQQYISLFTDIANKIRHTIELRKYNNLTIADYFRKQGAQVGSDCYIVIRNFGTEPYLIKIGNHVFIGEKVVFHTHDGGTWIFRQEMPELKVFGPVVIEDNCLIGEGVQILPNVTIGANSIVGSGSVVIKDVPENSIVMGVPARKIGSIEKYKEKCMQRWEMQKPDNVHPDALKPFWEQSPHKQEILDQFKKHLTRLFQDKLG